MTLIIATVTESLAMLTQDTGCLAPAGDSNGADPADVTSGTFGDAQRSSFSAPVAVPPAASATALKIGVFPSFKMAVGGAGEAAFHFAHLAALSEQLPMSATIDDVPLIAGNILRQLRQQREAATSYVAVFVGWSDTLGHPVAWSFTSGENFSGKRTGPGDGHVLMPASSDADPMYASLSARMFVAGKASADRQDVEEFHSDYAGNVWRACRKGLYGGRMVIGPPFTSAVFTKEGADCVVWVPTPRGFNVLSSGTSFPS